MSKGAAQPQEHVYTALRMAQAELSLIKTYRIRTGLSSQNGCAKIVVVFSRPARLGRIL